MTSSYDNNYKTPVGAPFRPAIPVRSLADIHALEATPLAQALTVRSTYEIFRNAGHAFGDKTALTFLRTGNPADEPIRWSYAELLARIHQTANMLHTLGVGPNDAVAVLLPGCLEYHLALWGGEAAGIVQPLNPLLTDEKLVALMTAARAKVLIAYGSDSESGMWSKAMRLRGQVPTLTTVLRVAPHDEAPGAAVSLPEGVAEFDVLRAAQPKDRLVSGRDIVPTDIAAYFHTGGTTGAPKLARHSHGAQVFTAWASVQVAGMNEHGISINGYPLFHVAGVLPASLSSLSAGVEVIIPTPSLLRNKQVLANYWKLVARYRPTSLSAVPTVLAALANVPLDGADISSITYCRTGAAVLAPELAARFERLFGLHVHESLGMTEMAGISTITPPGVDGPAGCVGFRLPYMQMRVVALDENGNASDREVAPGEQGMVLFKSPNVFSGFCRPGRQRQGLHRRRLARHRRPGLDRQPGAAEPHGPLEGPDHPQRPQHRPQDHRGRAGRAPGRAAVRRRGRARCLRGRAAGDLRDAGARRLGDRRRTAGLHRRARRTRHRPSPSGCR
jgi:fatty-acyl-CoA synthase